MMKFSRENLKLLREGETRKYSCDSTAALYSAAASTSAWGRIVGSKYSVAKDFDKCVVTITRLPLHVTEKR